MKKSARNDTFNQEFIQKIIYIYIFSFKKNVNSIYKYILFINKGTEAKEIFNYDYQESWVVFRTIPLPKIQGECSENIEINVNHLL